VADYGAMAQRLMETWPVRAARGAFDAIMLPGQVASGQLATQPSQPGMWSDEDEARSQMTQRGIGNRAADLAGLITGGSYAAPAMQNATGMGIRAYHGSPHDFDRFDLAKAGTTTDSGQLGRGLYFSTDPQVAAKSPHKYETDISLQNPFELEFPNWKTGKQSLIAEKLGLPHNATSDDIANAAKAMGHDGVVLDYSPAGYNQKEVAVFDDKLVQIIKKYGIAGAASMLGVSQSDIADAAQAAP